MSARLQNIARRIAREHSITDLGINSAYWRSPIYVDKIAGFRGKRCYVIHAGTQFGYILAPTVAESEKILREMESDLNAGPHFAGEQEACNGDGYGDEYTRDES